MVFLNTNEKKQRRFANARDLDRVEEIHSGFLLVFLSMTSLISLVQHLLRKLPISSVCLLVTVVLGLLHIRSGDLYANYAADGNRTPMVTFLLSGIATLGTLARELRSSNIATTVPVLVIRYGILFIVGS